MFAKSNKVKATAGTLDTKTGMKWDDHGSTSCSGFDACSSTILSGLSPSSWGLPAINNVFVSSASIRCQLRSTFFATAEGKPGPALISCIAPHYVINILLVAVARGILGEEGPYRNRVLFDD